MFWVTNITWALGKRLPLQCWEMFMIINVCQHHASLVLKWEGYQTGTMIIRQTKIFDSPWLSGNVSAFSNMHLSIVVIVIAWKGRSLRSTSWAAAPVSRGFSTISVVGAVRSEVGTIAAVRTFSSCTHLGDLVEINGFEIQVMSHKSCSLP